MRVDQVLKLMRDHLGDGSVGPDDDFFAVGGDSLVALSLIGDAQELGLPVTLLDLVDCPSARSLADRAGRADAASAHAEAPRDVGPFGLMDPMDRAVVPAGAEDVLPASALQVGIAYLCARTRDPALYHDVAHMVVQGHFDDDLFRQSLAALCRRHPALRSALDLGSFSTAAQVVWTDVVLPVSVEQLAGRDLLQAARRADQWQERQLAAGISWDEPPPGACHVVALDDAFHLTLAIHHAFVDGWSYARLAVDLLTIYDELLTGRSSVLRPPLPHASRDFLLLEQAALADPEASAFWRAQADAPGPLLAAESTPGLADASCQVGFEVVGDQLTRLRAGARSAGVPLKNLLLGGFTEALAQSTGRRDQLVTGVVTSGRPEASGAERAVGLFLNTLPLQFSEVAGTWDARARHAFTVENQAQAHRRYPLARIEQQLGRRAFDVAFNFTHFHVLDELRDLQELRLLSWSSFDKTSFPLMVDVAIDAPDHGAVRFTFDPALISEGDVRALSAHYRREIREVADLQT